MTDGRLFVPLNSRPYYAFEDGSKDVELRGVDPRFNERTVVVGRAVELRRGYSTPDSLFGTVAERWFAPDLDALDHLRDRITPWAGTHEAFVESVYEVLGPRDRYVAFGVDL